MVFIALSSWNALKIRIFFPTWEHFEPIFVTTLDSLYFQDDFANNREFITMVVYKTDGKKVYYPGMFSRQTFKQTLKLHLPD